MWGFVKRSAKKFNNPYIGRRLETALVRPILEYSVVGSAPYYQGQIDRIVSVHHRAIISNSYPSTQTGNFLAAKNAAEHFYPDREQFLRAVSSFLTGLLIQGTLRAPQEVPFQEIYIKKGMDLCIFFQFTFLLFTGNSIGILSLLILFTVGIYSTR